VPAQAALSQRRSEAGLSPTAGVRAQQVFVAEGARTARGQGKGTSKGPDPASPGPFGGGAGRTQGSKWGVTWPGAESMFALRGGTNPPPAATGSDGSAPRRTAPQAVFWSSFGGRRAEGARKARGRCAGRGQGDARRAEPGPLATAAKEPRPATGRRRAAAHFFGVSRRKARGRRAEGARKVGQSRPRQRQREGNWPAYSARDPRRERFDGEPNSLYSRFRAIYVILMTRRIIELQTL
jgi:hypothetical protein